VISCLHFSNEIQDLILAQGRQRLFRPISRIIEYACTLFMSLLTVIVGNSTSWLAVALPLPILRREGLGNSFSMLTPIKENEWAGTVSLYWRAPGTLGSDLGATVVTELCSSWQYLATFRAFLGRHLAWRLGHRGYALATVGAEL